MQWPAREQHPNLDQDRRDVVIDLLAKQPVLVELEDRGHRDVDPPSGRGNPGECPVVRAGDPRFTDHGLVGVVHLLGLGMEVGEALHETLQ